jgi:hypothetical protein
MFKIEMEKECGCFKKSEYTKTMSFDSKDEALTQAMLMENHMNKEFCQKHEFKAVEEGENKIFIRVQDREKESHSGCCGGGHCS